MPSQQLSATADSQATTQPQLTATLGLPTSFNWCTQNGGCPPVRDQGQCGGCWAFATQGPLECLIKAKDKVTVDLSEQYLLSCNDEDWGCNGGFWAHDYNMTKKVSGEQQAGAPLESTMPYKAQDTSCNPPHAKAYKITSWGYVCGNDQCTPTTDQMKQAIFDRGPLAVAVCVDSAFQNYTGGVFTGGFWGCYTVNHDVLLVGWDDNSSCWIMRNSWGSAWGESGYMRIRYGVGKIGAAA
ncbi:MAG: hypothetical protein HZB24_02010, partial [Desulfobacterales bacterium]|nr:hypothetical protein [Desulfobacterales bacterium]